MLLTYLQEIETIGLQIVDILLENEIIMKALHFELATSRLTINAKNREAARQVLVEGKTRGEVAKELGIDESQLSKQIYRIMANLKKQLDEKGLILQECIVDKDMNTILEIVEAKCLAYLKEDDPKKRRRRKKPVANTNDESATDQVNQPSDTPQDT